MFDENVYKAKCSSCIHSAFKYIFFVSHVQGSFFGFSKFWVTQKQGSVEDWIGDTNSSWVMFLAVYFTSVCQVQCLEQNYCDTSLKPKFFLVPLPSSLWHCGWCTQVQVVAVGLCLLLLSRQFVRFDIFTQGNEVRGRRIIWKFSLLCFGVCQSY